MLRRGTTALGASERIPWGWAAEPRYRRSRDPSTAQEVALRASSCFAQDDNTCVDNGGLGYQGHDLAFLGLRGGFGFEAGDLGQEWWRLRPAGKLSATA